MFFIFLNTNRLHIDKQDLFSCKFVSVICYVSDTSYRG